MPIPVHPDDRHLLGLKWGGKVLVDKALPFGLRSAPCALAEALGWILEARAVEWSIHYIDDMGPADSEKCHVYLELIKEFLGLPSEEREDRRPGMRSGDHP